MHGLILLNLFETRRDSVKAFFASQPPNHIFQSQLFSVMFRYRDLDPYDMFFDNIYTDTGGINRSSFAPVSDRAYRALDTV